MYNIQPPQLMGYKHIKIGSLREEQLHLSPKLLRHQLDIEVFPDIPQNLDQPAVELNS
jgi:hypothetical protein